MLHTLWYPLRKKSVTNGQISVIPMGHLQISLNKKYIPPKGRFMYLKHFGAARFWKKIVPGHAPTDLSMKVVKDGHQSPISGHHIWRGSRTVTAYVKGTTTYEAYLSYRHSFATPHRNTFVR